MNQFTVIKKKIVQRSSAADALLIEVHRPFTAKLCNSFIFNIYKYMVYLMPQSRILYDITH